VVDVVDHLKGGFALALCLVAERYPFSQGVRINFAEHGS